MRIGIGYDVHPLEKGRPLYIGGIEIPSYDAFTRLWATAYAIPAIQGRTWNDILSRFAHQPEIESTSTSGGTTAAEEVRIGNTQATSTDQTTATSTPNTTIPKTASAAPVTISPESQPPNITTATEKFSTQKQVFKPATGAPITAKNVPESTQLTAAALNAGGTRFLYRFFTSIQTTFLKIGHLFYNLIF